MIERIAKKVFLLVACDVAAVVAALSIATHLVLGAWKIDVFGMPNAYYLFLLLPVLFIFSMSRAIKGELDSSLSSGTPAKAQMLALNINRKNVGVGFWWL